MVFTIASILHYYPSYSKNEVMDLTQSQIGMLLEMVGVINNPDLLNKYKPLKFSSEFEFEHYIIDKFKFK